MNFKSYENSIIGAVQCTLIVWLNLTSGQLILLKFDNIPCQQQFCISWYNIKGQLLWTFGNIEMSYTMAFICKNNLQKFANGHYFDSNSQHFHIS